MRGERGTDRRAVTLHEVEDAGGTPASARISATITALSGAISDGFRTMVQPAASAGATFAPIWFSGQFHGVISAQTPTGSETTVDVPTLLLELEALQRLQRDREVPEPGGGLRARGEPGRRAHLQADRLREVARARHVDLDDPPEQRDALLPRRRGETVERGARRGDGPVDIRLSPQGDRRQRLLGRGVDDVERVLGRWLHRLTADEEHAACSSVSG